MIHNDVIKLLKEQNGGELNINNGEVYFLFTKDAMVSVYLDTESRTIKMEIDGLPEDNYKVYHSDVNLGLYEKKEDEINTIQDLVKKHPSLLNYDYKWLDSPNYRALGTAIGELGYEFKHGQDYHGQSDYNDIKAYYNVEIVPNRGEE